MCISFFIMAYTNFTQTENISLNILTQRQAQKGKRRQNIRRFSSKPAMTLEGGSTSEKALLFTH